MVRLVLDLLSNWKWSYPYDDWKEERPDTGSFVLALNTPLTHALVERVDDATGNLHPSGWHSFPRMARS